MAKVFLINVGANVGHSSKARSPLFSSGAFEYVSFPEKSSPSQYPKAVHPFVKDTTATTHLDPDWPNLTYGDCCSVPRAVSLFRAQRDDVFLFWALLWRMENGQPIWRATEKYWALIGALRVEHILEAGDGLQKLSADQRRRASSNAHVVQDRVENRDRSRVFIGCLQNSARFERAVDLGIYDDEGLRRKIFRTVDQRQIEWERSPRWNSATRSCRCLLDLSVPEERQRGEYLARSIQKTNPSYNLLRGL